MSLDLQQEVHLITSVDVLGTRVACVGVPQILDLARAWVKSRQARTIMYANAHALNLAAQDPTYLQALNQADLVCADGISVVWAGRLLGGNGLHKASGTEWIEPFCRLAHEEGWRLYLLAGCPGVAARAAATLTASWPGLHIAGTADGYFQQKDEAQVLAELQRADVDVLFVGMGTPRQELWVLRHRHQIAAPLCWTVGSLFDLVAGVEPWPPVLFKRLGLQWLWRLLVDPRGKWRRYLLGNPRFVYRVLRQACISR